MLWVLVAVVASGTNVLWAQANGDGSARSDSIAANRFPTKAGRQWLWGVGVGRLGLSTMNAYQKPTTNPPAMAAFIGHPEYSPGFFTLSLWAEKNQRSITSLIMAYRNQTLHFKHEYGAYPTGSSMDYLARLSWTYSLVSPDAGDKPSFILAAGPAVYYLNRDYQEQYADTLLGFRSARNVRAQILFFQVGPTCAVRMKNWILAGSAHFNVFGRISGNSMYDVIETPGPIGPHNEEAHFNETVGLNFISNNTVLLNDFEMTLVLLF
ncbi:MAG TPA: hypothetical protein PKD45_03835 [Flavobacteriales bacterium]|nr:hypothetical protein [Flavobacteriales bacterium]